MISCPTCHTHITSSHSCCSWLQIYSLLLFSLLFFSLICGSRFRQLMDITDEHWNDPQLLAHPAVPKDLTSHYSLWGFALSISVLSVGPKFTKFCDCRHFSDWNFIKILTGIDWIWINFDQIQQKIKKNCKIQSIYWFACRVQNVLSLHTDEHCHDHHWSTQPGQRVPTIINDFKKNSEVFLSKKKVVTFPN